MKRGGKVAPSSVACGQNGCGAPADVRTEWERTRVSSYRWGYGQLCTTKNFFSPAFQKKKKKKKKAFIFLPHRVV
jgi:hypothetical protein